PIPDTNAPMADLPPSGRGLVIAGDGRYDRPGLLEEARRLGWPLLATASSGLRGNEVIDVYHHILAGPLPDELVPETVVAIGAVGDRKSTRLNSSHVKISYAVFCLK